jgi:hypothetical protein
MFCGSGHFQSDIEIFVNYYRVPTYEHSWEIIAAILIGHRIDLYHIDPD